MLDGRFQPLAKRRGLAELAAQPAEEGDVSRVHHDIMLRYESARTTSQTTTPITTSAGSHTHTMTRRPWGLVGLSWRSAIASVFPARDGGETGSSSSGETGLLMGGDGIEPPTPCL